MGLKFFFTISLFINTFCAVIISCGIITSGFREAEVAIKFFAIAANITIFLLAFILEQKFFQCKLNVKNFIAIMFLALMLLFPVINMAAYFNYAFEEYQSSSPYNALLQGLLAENWAPSLVMDMLLSAFLCWGPIALLVGVWIAKPKIN